MIHTALAFHNEQLEASAFREQYDPESFEDLTEPKVEMIHKACLFFFLKCCPCRVVYTNVPVPLSAPVN